MDNLQELFDAYLVTKPSAEKIRSATVMMIHVGKALNVATQEEVTSEYFEEVTDAIDDFFAKTPQKATLDKAILAEMIGRVGPKGKLKRIYKKLLSDRDETVRQYALTSLEYIGEKRPKLVMEYVEQYRRSEDESIRMICVELIAKMLCQRKYKSILPQLKLWCAEDNGVFAIEVIRRVQDMKMQDSCAKAFEDLREWLMENFRSCWEEAFPTKNSQTGKKS
ncbi:MAG: hypothetical protein ACK2TU_01650 [Anaerolineales bacterium]